MFSNQDKRQWHSRSADEVLASVNITHDPIPSFNWPPMNLKVADAQMLEDIATGGQVMFQLKRLSPQEYVIIDKKVNE